MVRCLVPGPQPLPYDIVPADIVPDDAERYRGSTAARAGEDEDLPSADLYGTVVDRSGLRICRGGAGQCTTARDAGANAVGRRLPSETRLAWATGRPRRRVGLASQYHRNIANVEPKLAVKETLPTPTALKSILHKYVPET